MKQQAFEQAHEPFWQQLEVLLEHNGLDPDLPEHYRRLCHQFSLARKRRYSAYLQARLNRLVLGLHHRLYRHSARYRHQWWRFLMLDFPQALRANAGFVWVAAALFLVPGIIFWLGCFLNPELIYSLMPPDMVRQFEGMYDPAARVLGRERQSDTDLMMFGFYINNNISISFQEFAGGILFGLGTVFFLVYNGIFIGAAAGHITQVGYVETFYPFVIGHGAFELTAIVFSGAAGLKLGFALLAPGSLPRLTALRIAGREAVQIIYGSTLMLVIAAFLEAFWSSSTQLPIAVKYGVGALFWVLVLSYCCLAGRDDAQEHEHAA